MTGDAAPTFGDPEVERRRAIEEKVRK